MSALLSIAATQINDYLQTSQVMQGKVDVDLYSASSLTHL